MAKYLTVNSTFRPFSYQELLQPALMATEAHYQQEEALSALESEAAVWEKLGDNPLDRAQYETYKNYMQGITNARDALMKQGINASSRKGLMNLKRDYGQKIKPIAEAYDKREKEIQRQNNLYDTLGGNVVFSREARTTPLSTYMEGAPEYSQSNLNRVYEESIQGASNISKSQISYAERKAFNDAYYNLVKVQGINPTVATKELIESGKYPRLTEFYNQSLAKNEAVIGKTPYDEAGRQRIDDTIIQGINAGLTYDENWNLYQNWMLRDALNRKESEEPKDNSIYSPRIAVGTEGTVSKNVLRTKGLRNTGYGRYSTTKLDSLYEEMSEAEKEYNDFMNKLSDTTYKNLQASIHNSNLKEGEKTKSLSGPLPPTVLGEYNTLKTRYDNAKNKYEQELGDLKLIEEQYSHLGQNPYTRLYTGMKLEDMQEKHRVYDYPLTIESEDYNKIRKGAYSILNTFEEDLVERGTVGLVDSEGKLIKNFEKFNKIKDNFDKVSFKVRTGDNPGLRITYEGKDYTFKGIGAIEDYNKELKIINDYLKDFSKNIVKDAITITPEKYEEIMENGLKNTTVEVNGNLLEGTEFTSDVLYSPEYNDYIKILSDASGNIVAMNTLNDELSGGKLRDMYIHDMSMAGLINLSEIFAKDYGGK